MNTIYTNTISPEMRLVLKKLMDEKELQNFRLVGGTALALQLGHRKSIDIDLFTDKKFDVLKVFETLYDKHSFVQESIAEAGTRGYIGTVRCDFFNHNNNWIDEATEIEGIRMASVKEIAAMKIYAIVMSNGKRLKDFVDLATLSSRFSLSEMLENFREKYKNIIDTNALKSMFYFGNIDFSKLVLLSNNEKFDWTVFEKRFEQMQKNPNDVFPQLHNDKKMEI